MEKRYWEQFSKTGGVCDYLEYKICKEQDSVIIPLYREEDDTA